MEQKKKISCEYFSLNQACWPKIIKIGDYGLTFQNFCVDFRWNDSDCRNDSGSWTVGGSWAVGGLVVQEGWVRLEVMQVVSDE